MQACLVICAGLPQCKLTLSYLQAYLVIRTKRGESQQKRLKTILQSPVFKLHHEPQKFRQVSKDSLCLSVMAPLCLFC